LSIASDGCQEYGWYVELDGVRIAMLDYIGHVEMATYAYYIRPTKNGHSRAKEMESLEYWNQHFQQMQIRSRLNGKTATEFWLHGRPSGPYINMKSLYVDEPHSEYLDDYVIIENQHRFQKFKEKFRASPLK
jgi:hypothetical protein